jgi:glycosyltransferase involved in cell wall biosynthesis
MKIAYIGIKGIPSKWGADRVVDAIINNLPIDTVITVYCSLGHVKKTNPLKPNIKYVYIYVPPVFGKFQMVLVDIMSAFHALFFGNFDLIHLHNIEASFVLPILRIRYKVVSTSHGRMTGGNRWGNLAKRIIQLQEFPFAYLSIIATSVSKKDAQDLSNEYKRKIIFIPNGVSEDPEVNHIQANLLLGKYGITEETNFILFCAGRVIPLKGAHLLVAAFNKIKTIDKLIIVGDFSSDPDYYATLKNSADSRTVFIPFIENPAILNGLFLRAKLFVFPSYQEAMPMTLLEAASVGVPIVCSDIIANKTILEDKAIYFESENIGHLQKTIQWALTNREKHIDISKQAKDLVNSKYSWPSISEQYYQIYSEATK